MYACPCMLFYKLWTRSGHSQCKGWTPSSPPICLNWGSCHIVSWYDFDSLRCY
jgi:hypothetical protein